MRSVLRIRSLGIVLSFFAVFVFAGFSAVSAHQYVGVKKCGMCHHGAKKGMQKEIWEKSPHAKAFQTLLTEEAKVSAKKVGVDNPAESEKCLKCHTTGYGAAAEDFATGYSYRKEDGVTCEACHGPGSDYKKLSVMKDREKSVAAGMVVPDENTCKKCHIAEGNPNYKEFKFDEFFKQIAHPIPEKPAG